MPDSQTDLKKRFAADLRDLVAYPSVSSDPENRQIIAELAQFAAALCEKRGLSAQVITTDGNPLVYARSNWEAGWPVVRIYNHLDVQPADPNEWATPPFELHEREAGVFYGRGATDDKGPALVALYAIDQALREGVPLGFEILWETEEEIGSTHFSAAVNGLADRLAAADSVLISDTMWTAADKPTIIYGLRGLLGFEISLTTADQDVHSGTAGGVARNPANELAAIIASLTDTETGRVSVPDFYDGVIPATVDELRRLSDGFSLEQFQKDLGLHVTRQSDAQAAVRAIMTEPTLDVDGLHAGHIVDEGVQTVIPHTAVAQCSCRLVPGQTPEAVFQALRSYITDHHKDAKVRLIASAEPLLTDIEGPHVRALVAAYQHIGLEPAFIREGGSIGAAVTLAKGGSPVIMAGLSLPTDGYHAPNERFTWKQAHLGMQLFDRYFKAIARLSKG